MKACFLLNESASAVIVGNFIWEQLDILCKTLYSPQVAETFSIRDTAVFSLLLALSLRSLIKEFDECPAPPPHHRCPGRVYRIVALLSISM